MTNRRYETLVLIHADLGEPGAKDLAARVRGIIEGQGGVVSQVLEWGLRDLAYLIRKQRRAHYYLFEYRATAAVVAEVDRQLKIIDDVLRHISLQQDENAPPAQPPRPPRRESDEAGTEGGEEMTEGEAV